ncbi:unnamed protein product [Durusdinium trenchii]|uniref:Non-specific serine/threonine protein kinase n=3 Tax=Durusdinium trenchii TaxID=1381693 RepID=A0ABP0HWD7_9DINO
MRARGARPSTTGTIGVTGLATPRLPELAPSKSGDPKYLELQVPQEPSDDAKAARAKALREPLPRRVKLQPLENAATSDAKPSDAAPGAAPNAAPAPKAKGVNRKAFQACRKDADVRSVYSWEQRKVLGSGSFGEVFAVKHRFHSKKLVAIKQVSKEKCEHLEQLRMEISVLSRLQHPRILHFFEAYEDFKDIYIVTELCSGGDLQQCMAETKGELVFAHHAADQILRALIYCHSRGVCHRDLKPENVLLVRKLQPTDRTPPMRLADFGLSASVQAAQSNVCHQISHVKSRFSDGSMNEIPPMDSIVGTAEYMAPEVMAVLDAQIRAASPRGVARCKTRRCYDFRCDVWSLGVIIFSLLKGEAPYSLEEMVAYVEDQTSLPRLSSRAETLDPIALQFVEQCLRVPYRSRLSARQLAAEAFIKTQEPRSAFARIDKDGSGTVDMEELRQYLLDHGLREEHLEELFARLDLDKDGHISQAEFQEGFQAFIALKSMSGQVISEIIQNVEKFTKSSQLKKAVLTSAARHLGGYELQQLREIFESVDGNGDGAISKQEWQISFSLVGERFARSADWMEQAFVAMDTDGSGEIDYSEFLAAIMDSQLMERRDLLWAAFQDFDRSNVGSISQENLRLVLEGEALQGLFPKKDEGFVDSVLANVEESGGELSFEEFVELLQLD